jgi:hypothetical protein
MATITKEKQSVQANWPIERIQQEITKMIAGKIVTRLKLVESGAEDVVEKFGRMSAEQLAETLRHNGVKTPLQLVKYMAEHQANLFAAKVEYGGDENNATLFIENPTVWLEVKKIAPMSPEQEKLMQKHYENWKRHLAKSMGFESQVEIRDNTCTVTFSKP